MHKNIYITFLICLAVLVSCKQETKPLSTVINTAKTTTADDPSRLIPAPPALSSLPKYVQDGLAKLSTIKTTGDGADAQIMDFLKRGEFDFGEVFKLINVHFKANSPDFMDKPLDEIDNLAKIMLAFPKMLLKIDVYSDNSGDDKKNELLTQKKAENISERIYSLGVNKERLIAKGFGSKYPVGNNKTIEGQMINNRVEFTILRLQ